LLRLPCNRFVNLQVPATFFSPQRGKVGTSTRVAGAWIADFLEEAEPWPAGTS
jgi:hypothetical protein